MRKLLYAIPMLLIAIAIGNTSKASTPPYESCYDSTTVVTDSGKQVLYHITGKVWDAAMNSVLIITHTGDTVAFGYPELNPKNRVSTGLGKKITVTWIKYNGTDSVVNINYGKFKKPHAKKHHYKNAKK